MFPYPFFVGGPWTEIASALDEAAREVWADLAEVRSVGNRWGETTITETVFRNLLRRRLQGLGLYAFSQHEERVSGADMEIWFIQGDLSFGVRIQAKRLYMPADTYKMLDHNNGEQAGVLVSTKTSNLEPFYGFYNHFDHTKPNFPSAFSGIPSGNFELPTLGITIAPAAAVKAKCIDVSPRRKAIVDLAPLTLPWSWLLRPFELAALQSKDGRRLLRHIDRRYWSEYYPELFYDRFFLRGPFMDDLLSAIRQSPNFGTLPGIVAESTRQMDRLVRNDDSELSNEGFTPGPLPPYVNTAWLARTSPDLADNVEDQVRDSMSERGLRHLLLVGVSQ
jgi:hypothetical protein